MNPPVRPYLGETAAERVAARRRKLLDAGFELVASEGFGGVSVELLCKTTKLSKRYFYESFSDLDDLVTTIVDELAAELANRALAAAAEAAVRSFDTRRLARHALGTVLDYLLDDPRRARLLLREADRSKAVEAHRRATIRKLAGVLAVYGHQHHDARGTHPIADIASAMLVGGTIEVILRVVDGELVRSREALIDDVADLWVALGDGAVSIGKARAVTDGT